MSLLRVEGAVLVMTTSSDMPQPNRILPDYAMVARFADVVFGYCDGLAPIRAKKIRYFIDTNFKPRVLPAPKLQPGQYADSPAARINDWSGMVVAVTADASAGSFADDESIEDGGPRLQPELAEVDHGPEYEGSTSDLLLLYEDDIPTPFPTQPDPRLNRVARLAALDPNDGIAL